SRLEARYAVMFDYLGIDWEYEHEGYQLSNGKWYLPDFWLPNFNAGGMFVEVKHKFTEQEKETCRVLCVDAKKSVWLAEGTPSLRAWEYYRYDKGKANSIIGIPNADQADWENRMFVFPGYENEDLSIPEEYHESLGTNFINAITEACMARFEFLGGANV